ncbi:type II toxin-antitoxin system VapC family toxin [bacterium]|nr:type II toxin-antitoxin system VapC family toxin [bacterium]
MAASFVLDNSVAIAWFFEEQTFAYANKVMQRLRNESAIVPPVWPLEFSNTLLSAERRKRLSRADSMRIAWDVRSLNIEIAPMFPHDVFGDVATIARERGLSVYDASYLHLSMQLSLPIATLDKQLRRAAAAMDVQILDA